MRMALFLHCLLLLFFYLKKIDPPFLSYTAAEKIERRMALRI